MNIQQTVTPPASFEYSAWRHGGWYVHTVKYISGAIGCVSRNYPDKKWRVVEGDHSKTYKNRDDAALAEYNMTFCLDRAITDLQGNKDHHDVMLERFGKEGSSAALWNWNQSVKRYAERFGHQPPARLTSRQIAPEIAHLPEHPEDRVDPAHEDSCILWTGRTNDDGYGRDGAHFAHRLAWEAANGPIPAGMSVLHECDTPACINPNHLFLGTQADNMADRDRKGRGVHGERAPKAKLTAEAVTKYRARYLAGAAIGDLAKEAGITWDNMCKLVRGNHWRHVPMDHAALLEALPPVSGGAHTQEDEGYRYCPSCRPNGHEDDGAFDWDCPICDGAGIYYGPTPPDPDDDPDDCAILAAAHDRDDAETVHRGMACVNCGTPTNAYHREGEDVFRCDPCHDRLTSSRLAYAGDPLTAQGYLDEPDTGERWSCCGFQGCASCTGSPARSFSDIEIDLMNAAV